MARIERIPRKGPVRIPEPVRAPRTAGRVRITVDPRIHFGQPCVAGTRIPVYAILELVQAGVPFDRIVRDYYPDLTVRDVKACVQHAVNLVKSEEVHLAPSGKP